METEITTQVDKCAAALRAGELVAFPTETVYGLGANALDEDAVRRIFTVKGRPCDNPLIVHVAGVDQAKALAGEWPERVQALCDAFWPGPLTVIVPKGESVPDAVTAGLPCVGLRMPKHPLALALLSACGLPVAAPSANTSSRPSPTRPEHVYHDLHGKIPYILDGGKTQYGVESTVLDCTQSPFTILRPGSVTQEMLEAVIGRVQLSQGVLQPVQVEKAASPGMKYRHYAPGYQVVLVDGDEELMLSLCRKYQAKGQRVVVFTIGKAQYEGVESYLLGDNLEQVSSNMYDALIRFEGRADVVLCPVCSTGGVGLAVMNRLLRAAGFHVVKKGGEADV